MRNSRGCLSNPCTQHYKLAEKLVNGTINGLDWKVAFSCDAAWITQVAL